MLFCILCLSSVQVKSEDVDVSWGSWVDYGACSVSCGDGKQTRIRTCSDPVLENGEVKCPGPNNDTVSCNEGICPIVSDTWSSWSDCSRTCGDGVMTRNRSCDSLVPFNDSRLECNGSNTESTFCNIADCPPVNGCWGSWSSYSECTVSCGGGTQLRHRICDNPPSEYGGLDCDGPAIEYRPCEEDDCPGTNNKGKEFIFGFLTNYPGVTTDLTIFLTTKYENVAVKISTPLLDPSFDKTVVVHKNRVESVSISAAVMCSVDGLESKGVHVVAEQDIIVYAINKQNYSTDAFLVLPVDTLGQEYYVVSWGERSAFIIVGIEDETQISIKCGKQCPLVTINGMSYGPGISVNIALNKFQTHLASSEFGDFTGTHIYATKPVTVIAGSICASVGDGACDHLAKQMLPIEKLGKIYVTVGMPYCSTQDTYRIVASLDNTIVNISGSSTVNLERSGDYYTFNLPDQSAKTVTSDKAIAIALYANGGCNSNGFGDPTMILLPSIDQFAADYTFSTVSLQGQDFINSLALVIGEAYTAGLRMDNRMLPPVVWRTVEGRNDIKYTEFGIEKGAHSVYHIDPTVTFLLIVSGVQSYNSYGYPAGLNFNAQNANCGNNNNKSSTETRCNFGLDPCKDDSCINGGTCSPLGWTSSECICPNRFKGPICEIDLCKPYPSDIVFVIDSSSSIGSEYFEIQKQYIKDLMRNFTIDERNVQIAIVSFSSIGNMELDFSDASNETILYDKISELTLRGGSSQIHKGLNTGIKLMKNRNRKIDYVKAKKYLIVISDGLPSSPNDINSFASEEYTLHMVALGEDVSHYYLEKMAGSMSNVFSPNPDRLWNHMMFDLIHPICDMCHTSNETDLVILVDISRSMDNKDLIENIPDVTNKILNEMGTSYMNTRLSLVTYDSQTHIEFKYEQYSIDTKSRLQQKLSYFPRSISSVSNFTRVFSDVSDLLFDTQSGARRTANKIVLVISNFKTDIDKTTHEDITRMFNSSVDIFTIGVHSDEEAFDNMLRLASFSFHVGSIGEIFANQIDTFIRAFVKQLSYVKCSFG